MFAKKNKNRRRNLTDQQSKRAYSYYSNTRLRSDEQPVRDRQTTPKQHFKSSRNWFHYIPSILASIVIFVCLVYILGINSNPKIVQLSNQQNIFLHDNNTYQQAANKIIAKSWLNYNKITINAAGISHDLKLEFPELSDVSVTIPIINRRPVIYIAASQPTLLLITESNSTLVDARGVAILPANQITDITKYKLLAVKDELGLSVDTGKAVLPSNEVKFITDTYAQFKAQKLAVDQFILPTKANELDVKLVGQKYFIKMDMLGDSREQAGAYMATKAKLTSLHATPDQYIDVRVVGRVFYK